MRKYPSKFVCDFPGCGRPVHGRGLCKNHGLQQRKSGKLFPIHSTKRPDGTPPRITYDEAPCPKPELVGPCHIFRGSKTRLGYGHVGLNGKLVMPHRYLWIQKHGPVPAGLEVDHRCQVRACCNVDHLRVVTHKVNCTENVARKTRTHCPKGHELTEANTYRNPKGWRTCRTCQRIAQAECKRKLKKSMPPPAKQAQFPALTDDEQTLLVEQEDLLRGAAPKEPAKP